MDRFDQLRSNKLAIDDVLSEMKHQFDEFHNIRHKARKLVERNRLNMLSNSSELGDEYFSEFMLSDKD